MEELERNGPNFVWGLGGGEGWLKYGSEIGDTKEVKMPQLSWNAQGRPPKAQGYLKYSNVLFCFV